MAWPPTLPTGNRTNATPQTDTHPNEHNTTNAALAAIVKQFGFFNEFAGSLQPNSTVNVTLVSVADSPQRPLVFATAYDDGPNSYKALPAKPINNGGQWTCSIYVCFPNGDPANAIPMVVAYWTIPMGA